MEIGNWKLGAVKRGGFKSIGDLNYWRVARKWETQNRIALHFLFSIFQFPFSSFYFPFSNFQFPVSIRT